MITHVSLVTVYCTSQQAAHDFYVGQLGMQVRADSMSDGVRWLLVGPQDQPQLSLMLLEPGPPLPPESAEALREVLDRGGLGGVTLAVDDCRATVAELTGRGVALLHEPTEQPFGTEAVIDDGCGNAVVIIQYRT